MPQWKCRWPVSAYAATAVNRTIGTTASQPMSCLGEDADGRSERHSSATSPSHTQGSSSSDWPTMFLSIQSRRTPASSSRPRVLCHTKEIQLVVRVPHEDGREQERGHGEGQIGPRMGEPAPLLPVQEHVEAGADDQQHRGVLAQHGEPEHGPRRRPPGERPRRSRFHQ